MGLKTFPHKGAVTSVRRRSRQRLSKGFQRFQHMALLFFVFFGTDSIGRPAGYMAVLPRRKYEPDRPVRRKRQLWKTKS